jgi:hypothetical protein
MDEIDRFTWGEDKCIVKENGKLYISMLRPAFKTIPPPDFILKYREALHTLASAQQAE